MFFSRAELFGFGVAIIVIVTMGIIVFTGPFHKISKTQAAASSFSPVMVTIKTDPKVIGIYTPDPITVHPFQKVVFKNLSNSPHTATAKNGAFNSGDLGVNNTWTLVSPKTPGVYKYVCLYHALMHGTLIVKA